MTEHSRAAERWIKNAISAQASEEPETLCAAYGAIATAHATLALMEQQRIANLIAWLNLRDWDKAVTCRVMGDDSESVIVDEIQKGLGL